ncbi:MAG TPA: hypothetical protein VN924_28580 [Bryobacteraceae bacterium]|nr:hypothetical protein [Bryobacteraceae bacterium]
MAQSKAESFTAYLEAKQRSKREQQSQPVNGGTALSVLAALAESTRNSMALSELQATSGMNFTSFAEAIKRLGDLGYIAVAGAPGSESAELTKLGKDVAAIAQPL